LIEPFFLGQQEQQVFASYHPPSGIGPERLTVLCAPLFSEYMRTQLALRQLAISLAELGHHVLRFDYRGTGDSFGEIEKLRLSDWSDDVAAVVAEGRDISGVQEVNFVSVRVGALIAAQALEKVGKLRSVVFWDPVISGDVYIHSLAKIQQHMIRRNRFMSRSERKLAAKELGGRLLAPELVNDFNAASIDWQGEFGSRAPTVVITGANGSHSLPSTVERILVKFECHWGSDSEDVMLARPVLEKIWTQMSKS
jgi:pimeloyl-ACP methyl ester carboxylesterase